MKQTNTNYDNDSSSGKRKLIARLAALVLVIALGSSIVASCASAFF